ncbi:MAG: hypothetical protein HYR63_23060 [Proteobacteria bacterium]|nr:hypothetical protein [Pseudomonadota bacterium]
MDRSDDLAEKDNPELEAAFVDLKSKPTPKERPEAGNRFNTRLFGQLYAVKLGDNGRLQAVRSELVGFKPCRAPRAWVVSLR